MRFFRTFPKLSFSSSIVCVFSSQSSATGEQEAWRYLNNF